MILTVKTIIASCRIVVWKLFHILISLRKEPSFFIHPCICSVGVLKGFWSLFFLQNGCQNGNCHFGNLSFEFSVKVIASFFMRSAIFFLDSKVKSSVQEYWLFIVSFRDNSHKFISSQTSNVLCRWRVAVVFGLSDTWAIHSLCAASWVRYSGSLKWTSRALPYEFKTEVVFGTAQGQVEVSRKLAWGISLPVSWPLAVLEL